MATATMAAMFSFRWTAFSPHKSIQSASAPFSTPFIKKQTLSFNLTSSHSVCGLRPFVFSRSFDVASAVGRNSQPLTVVCAKGYKMKTHKASAKRFRVSGSGKIMRRRAGKQHLLRKKNAKRRLRLSKLVQVDRSDYNNVLGALPYLKVNRSN